MILMFVVESNPTSVPAIQQAIVSRLLQLADPDVARTAQKFFPEKIVCFGIRAADLRALSREIYDLVKPAWKIDQALDLAGGLLARPELEARSCGLLILSRFHSELNQARLDRIRSWLRKGHLDNWALIDTLSLEVLGPFFRKNPGQLKILEKWAGDRNLYLRRAALVTLVKLSRDRKILGFIFKMVCIAVPVEKSDDLVAKAAGWLLREAGKTDGHSLEKFLLRYGKKLPRITVRYALEKFGPGRKAYFMKITKA